MKWVNQILRRISLGLHIVSATIQLCSCVTKASIWNWQKCVLYLWMLTCEFHIKTYMSSTVIFPNYISHLYLYFTSSGINLYLISFKKQKGRQLLDWLIQKHSIQFVNQSVIVGAMITGLQVRESTVAPSIPSLSVSIEFMYVSKSPSRFSQKVAVSISQIPESGREALRICGFCLLFCCS